MRREVNRRRAVLLMGPTGSGKSDLGMRLAETLPLEIISVDSALGRVPANTRSNVRNTKS